MTLTIIFAITIAITEVVMWLCVKARTRGKLPRRDLR